MARRSHYLAGLANHKEVQAHGNDAVRILIVVLLSSVAVYNLETK
jgi:hypothetical protein